MEVANGFTEKFVACLTNENFATNELMIPVSFLAKFGEELLENVTVILRDGIRHKLVFDKERKVFFGINSVLQSIESRIETCVLFQYFTKGHFFLYVLSVDGCEIINDGVSKRFDDSVFKYQGWCSIEGVMKFTIQLDCTKPLIDIELPRTFIDSFGETIPLKIYIVLNNGQVFEGRYCVVEKKLHALCDVMHFISRGKSTRLIFTYDGDNMFYVNAFDRNGMEKSLLLRQLEYPDYKSSIEINFEIEVKEYHLLSYCYGVYIHRRFHHLTDHWKNRSHIVVYHENSVWNIEVRMKKKKTTLHNGWVTFSKDMNLKAGDVCSFLMRECYLEFDVEIVRNSTSNV